MKAQAGDRRSLRHPLVAVLTVVIGGMGLDRLLTPPLWCWYLLATFGLFTWAACRVSGKRIATPRPSRDQGRVWPQELTLALSLLAVAAGWHQLRWCHFPADDVGLEATDQPQPVALEAVLLESPQLLLRDPGEMPMGGTAREGRKEEYSRCLIRVHRRRHGAIWRLASGEMRMLVAGHLRMRQAGDRVRVWGELARPARAMNPGNFSFRDYERGERRLGTLRVGCPQAVTLLSPAHGADPRWWLARCRARAHQQLWAYLPPPSAGLAEALLLGNRVHLSRERADAFLRTGTVHFLAISGLHVGLLAAGLYLLARTAIIPPRLALFAVMLLTVAYAALSGARPPVLRATLLVVAFCTAALLRRPTLAMNTLAATALIVLALNPCRLFQTGTQLSFLAVAAMIWFVPRLQRTSSPSPLARLLARRRSFWQMLYHGYLRQLGSAALVSTVVWLATLPLCMYQFHLLSPVALLLNLFLWIPIGTALLGGLAILLLGWLSPAAATAASWLCHGALQSVELVVGWAQGWPGSYYWVAGPSLAGVLGVYGTLFLGCQIARSRQGWAAVPLLATTLFLADLWRPTGTLLGGKTERLQCDFLSLGHGTCVVMRLPDGRVWLYDAGALGSSRTALDRIATFLWSCRTTRIEGILLSHADLDHFNAVSGLTQRFSVRRVLVTPATDRSTEPAWQKLRADLRRARIPVQHVTAGSCLPVGRQVRIDLLHPAAEPTPFFTSRQLLPVYNDNAQSIVARVSFAGRSLLLTGDLEQQGLNSLLASAPRKCDILMAPHHGSGRSQPAAICAWCRPCCVVICAASRASLTSGPADYATRVAQVCHTGTAGTVRVTLHGDSRLGIDTYLGGTFASPTAGADASGQSRSTARQAGGASRAEMTAVGLTSGLPGR